MIQYTTAIIFAAISVKTTVNFGGSEKFELFAGIRKFCLTHNRRRISSQFSVIFSRNLIYQIFLIAWAPKLKVLVERILCDR